MRLKFHIEASDELPKTRGLRHCIDNGHLMKMLQVKVI